MAKNPIIGSDGFFDADVANGMWVDPSVITLRDLFAAFALAGFLASEDRELDAGHMESDYATDAYRMADAMLIERERKP